MKRILSLLGVVTITSSGLTTLTNNNFTSKNNHYLQINNYNQLRSNFNRLEVYYRFLTNDSLKAHISYTTWQNIAFEWETLEKGGEEFQSKLFSILKNFEQVNHSGGGDTDRLYNQDIHHFINVIVNHYSDFEAVFKKLKPNQGLVVETLRDETWSNYSSDYGVFPD